MLRKAGYTGHAENSKIHQTKDDKLYSQSGAKYHGKRSGMASQLDANINKRHEERMMENYGDGFVNYKAVKNDGSDLANPPPMNIDGRLHYANKAGFFRILDADLIHKKAEIERERAEYVEKILEDCILSDDICAHVLGVDGLLSDALGPDKSRGYFGLTDSVSKELDKYDSTPNYLNSFGSAVGNTFYAGGITKLRAIIKSQMPIITGMTTSAVANTE